MGQLALKVVATPGTRMLVVVDRVLLIGETGEILLDDGRFESKSNMLIEPLLPDLAGHVVVVV